MQNIQKSCSEAEFHLLDFEYEYVPSLGEYTAKMNKFRYDIFLEASKHHN